MYSSDLDICKSGRTTVHAIIHTLPSVSLGPDTITILSGQTTTLDPGPGYADYLWSTAETTQTIDVDTSGIFSVLVTDVNGCQGSDTVVVNLITAVSHPDVIAGWQVYPNPAHDAVTVTLQALREEKAHIRLFDPEGRQIGSAHV